ncbi:hypothetical protein SAMN04487831_11526 [Pseudobutyrivibrio sp. UC1225]|uniref:hypothetical protein n=1 Tax=Pseudobutyrivibrio sp. UC1225 TaxID=1798185 RepID=UPI0008ED121B|nr:hypothetical protein [Pseudobutyrivibrio sp. UC1225]SFO26969.1 hypothetical protein SAMN04487831_11526 [Pseudobutyrivibrio sp. UC1225]
MKKSAKKIARSIIVCSVIAVGFSLTSVRAEAIEFQNAELSNISIIKVSPENMEEYNGILDNIDLVKFRIDKYDTELAEYLEQYEWFFWQYGTKEELEAWINKREEDYVAAMATYSAAMGEAQVLEEKKDELKRKYRSAYNDGDYDTANVIKEEIEKITAEISYWDSIAGPALDYIEYFLDPSSYVYRGANPDDLMTTFNEIEATKQHYADLIADLERTLEDLYKRLAELEEPDEPIDEPIDEIIYTDETFEFPIGNEQLSLYVKIHFVGKVRNQPEVARLLMTVTPTSNNYIEVISKVIPDLSGHIDVEISGVYGVVYSEQLDVDFID